MQPNKIDCPNCGHNFDLNETVYNQLSEKVKTDFNQKLILEKKEIEEKIRKQFHEEKNQELSSYQNELKRKTEQLTEFHKTKAEFERMKREKEELQFKLESEFEQKLTDKLGAERTRILNEVEEKNNLKLLEREHVISQLHEKLKEAHKKAEQGSMQIQGEVQEEALEKFLKDSFPLDTIEEIKKGARGADCLQIVNSRTRKNCGKIYYESKRTKDFQISWIEKFKTDMREKSAMFGVLVTDVYPKGHQRMLQIDGVWVCSIAEFKGLSHVLRECVLQLDQVNISQVNKGEKMQMLYDYLTGNEFYSTIETVVETFSQMHTDLEKEKRAMESIWKKRQTQIDKVCLNTSHLYSSVKGIAGAAIKTVHLLELPSN